MTLEEFIRKVHYGNDPVASHWMQDSIDWTKPIIAEFYREVCKRAESKMLTMHKLEGAHYAAMKELLEELGVEI